MRVALLYSIPPLRVEPRRKGVVEYLRSSLEKILEEALRKGAIDDELRDMYVSALESLERGRIVYRKRPEK